MSEDPQKQVMISTGTRVQEAVDVANPTRDILRELNLLSDEEDRGKVAAGRGAFGGTPDSVAVIEAGLTAGAKWWSVILGGAAVGIWGVVNTFWRQQDADSQRMLILAAAIAAAAAVLAVGYILGSDIRGRAAASAATIEARARVAESVIGAVPQVHEFRRAAPPPLDEPTLDVLPISTLLGNHLGGMAKGERDLRACLRTAGDGMFLLVVKGGKLEGAGGRK